MSYILLIVTLTILCIVSFYIFKKDILSPTVVSCGMFLFAVIMSLVGKFTWNNVSTLNYKTIIILIIGIVFFGIGEYFARKVMHKLSKTKNNESETTYKVQEIKIKKYKFIISCIFMLVTLILLFTEIHRISVYYGNDTWNVAQILSTYREKSGLFSNAIKDDGVGINFVLKQMQKLSLIMSVFYGYIFANNFFVNKKDKLNYLNVIPIILGVLTTFTYNGGRSLFFHICIAIAITFLIFYKNIFAENHIKRILKLVTILSLIFVILFFVLQTIVGRNTKANFTEYTSFYFGTAIPSFDIYIQKGEQESKYGGLTFKSVFYVLDKLKIIEYKEVITHKWISFKGTSGNLSSNIYTSMMNYYNDFKIIGVCILQLIFGFVFTLLYLKAVTLKNRVITIFFSYNYYVLLEQIRDETFYSLINTSTIAMILCILIVEYLLFRDFNDVKYLITKGKKNEKKLPI